MDLKVFEGRSTRVLNDKPLFDEAVRAAVEHAKNELEHHGAFQWRLRSVEGFEGGFTWESTIIATIEAWVPKPQSSE